MIRINWKNGHMKYQPVIDRRTALKVLGGGLVVGTAAPVSARSNELSQELNSLRKATQKYKDVGEAREDGYVVVSEYVSEMGFHFIHPGRLALTSAPDSDRTAPGTVEIKEPPILVYFTTGNYDPDSGDEHDSDRDDDLRLGGVEYAHLEDDGTPGTPSDYFSDEEASRNLKVSEEDGWEWVPGPDITALHVWVHRGNPAGVFHPTNPTID